MSTLRQPAPIREAMFLSNGALSPMWAKWFENVRVVANTKLDSASDPTEDNVVIFTADGNITDSGIDVSDVIEPDDILGTTNQITVTDNGDGTVTLTIPDSFIIPVDATVTGDLSVGGDEVITGTLEVTDDTTLDADLIFDGDGSGVAYGSMYADDISETVTVSASNTWYEIDGGNFTTGQNNLTALDSAYRIQVTNAGRYLINWSLVFETAAAAQYLEATVGVNGTENEQGVNATETATANKQYSVSGTCILDLAASDYVSLMVENDTSTQDIIVTHGNLTLVMVGGT